MSLLDASSYAELIADWPVVVLGVCTVLIVVCALVGILVPDLPDFSDPLRVSFFFFFYWFQPTICCLFLSFPLWWYELFPSLLLSFLPKGFWATGNSHWSATGHMGQHGEKHRLQSDPGQLPLQICRWTGQKVLLTHLWFTEHTFSFLGHHFTKQLVGSCFTRSINTYKTKKKKQTNTLSSQPGSKARKHDCCSKVSQKQTAMWWKISLRSCGAAAGVTSMTEIAEGRRGVDWCCWYPLTCLNSPPLERKGEQSRAVLAHRVRLSAPGFTLVCVCLDLFFVQPLGFHLTTD